MTEKRYEHKPEVVMGNDKCKILWYFTVQTNQEIYWRRPDFVVVKKDKNLFQIINFAYLYDRRVDTKEVEKTEHYQDLVILLVKGVLGTTPI